MYRSEGNEFYNYLLYGMYANCGYPALSKKAQNSYQIIRRFQLCPLLPPLLLPFLTVAQH